MKKYITNKVWSLLAVIVFLPYQAKATPASLSIEDFCIKAGETKEMVIDMTNPDDQITLVQFDLRLPDGLSIAIEDGDFAIDIAGRTTWKKHSLSANALDGVTRFLLASNTNAVISGTEGAIISVKLLADDTFSEGDISLENILLVTPLQKETKPDTYIYNIMCNILDGDANNNGIVDASDIVEIANYMMGNPSGNYNKMAADVNGDGVVNTADVVAIDNIIIITNTPVTPELKKTSIDLGDYYADCGTIENSVKWNDIEYNVYNLFDGMSKLIFDANFEIDQYSSYSVERTLGNNTTVKVNTCMAEQYEQDTNEEDMFTKLTSSQRLGEVIEEWNEEDATTHILKWRLGNKDFWTLYKTLKQRNNLYRSGTDITNKREISTWVRYKRKGSSDGEPALYIKFTIPVGKLHFAKATLNGSKTLTYWYDLNSNNNAYDSRSAKEVRINVPVPTPNSAVTVLSDEATCVDNTDDGPVQYISDNLLERTEFVKDLHDYFINGELNAKVADSHFSMLRRLVIHPEFEFTLPSLSVGNASFDADSKGQWIVKGYTGTTYTLQLNDARNEILIAKAGYMTLSPMPVLVCLTRDLNSLGAVQSVIKYHEGKYQDDILNAYGHTQLGERETFTAYIQMSTTPDACAPVELDDDDMWFNVRFIRPLDLQNPTQGLLSDALNDWQYVDLTKYINVYDWREYLGDPNNTTGGKDMNHKFDFAYYQIDFSTDEAKFLTDAHLGTAERDSQYTIGKMIDINYDAAYAAKLKNYSIIPGLVLEKINNTTIRYRNNSNTTGNFHVYIPVQMTYVFGQDASLGQTKYITIGITSTANQN